MKSASMKFKGYLFAALAAGAYGTNPAFAVPLYGEGMNALSVLLFRYLMGLPILAAMIAWRGRSFRLPPEQRWPVAILGVLMAASSLALFEAYNYMNSGVASTLLFVYPVMVAVLMTFFFHERFKTTTGLCLIVMGLGLGLLMHKNDGESVSAMGFVLVMASSLTYAIYLVMINVSKQIRKIPTLTLLFYTLLSGSALFGIMLLPGGLAMPPTAGSWINLVALALIPTVISLLLTTRAIQLIGSTPTAIFGALEPVTAVVLSIVILNQDITANEIYGGVLIIVATTLVVVSDPVETVLLRMRKMFPSVRRKKGSK